MSNSSTITIGGYPLDVMRRTYSVWQHFKPEDRIIRSRRADKGNPHLRRIPTTEIEAQQLQIDFAYSTSADIMRRRLGRAGFTWTTLEQEYQRYYEVVCQLPGNLFFFGDRETASASARADAFRTATFEDWLEALAECVATGATWMRKGTREVAKSKNILVDIITDKEYPIRDGRPPKHSVSGFPCDSLDNMAVALLEVMPENVLCEQEVSLFVQYEGDTTFDDMRLRKVRHDEEDYI